MSYLINNQQKLNDVVFANRNKAYGAYAIRSAYGNTVLKSLSIMVFGFATIFAIGFYMNNKNNNENAKLIPVSKFNFKDSVYTVQVDATPKIETPVTTVKPPEAPNSNLSSTTSTVIVESSTLEAKPTESITGTGTATNSTENTIGSGTSTLTSSITITSTITGTVSADPVHIPDSQPEYEGGLKALYAFVGSKLKYPEDATDRGKEGIVYVKFVVDQNGKVGSLSLLNNVGFGLDEEALRVVGMIPNFKTPGKVDGKAVKVYYQLPIKFKMH